MGNELDKIGQQIIPYTKSLYTRCCTKDSCGYEKGKAGDEK